jgi:hypothetical protein
MAYEHPDARRLRRLAAAEAAADPVWADGYLFLVTAGREPHKFTYGPGSFGYWLSPPWVIDWVGCPYHLPAVPYRGFDNGMTWMQAPTPADVDAVWVHCWEKAAAPLRGSKMRKL